MTEDRLQALRNKLVASERLGDGYGERAKAIRAEIERLERDANDNA